MLMLPKSLLKLFNGRILVSEAVVLLRIQILLFSETLVQFLDLSVPFIQSPEYLADVRVEGL